MFDPHAFASPEHKFAVKVVDAWCRRHNVPLESEPGRTAVSIAVRRIRAGENSPVALAEQLRSVMNVERYKRPWD